MSCKLPATAMTFSAREVERIALAGSFLVARDDLGRLAAIASEMEARRQ
jgi:hypothetical protein